MFELKLLLQGDVRSERGNITLYNSHRTFIIAFHHKFVLILLANCFGSNGWKQLAV